MDLVAGELLVKIIGGGAAGGALIIAVVYIVKQLLGRLAAVESAMKELAAAVINAKAEADRRVTVPDHRESMNQVWTVVRAVEGAARDLATHRQRDREEFAELRAEVRAKKGR